MSDERFRRLIEQGDVDGVRSALEADPGLANRMIRWHLNQDNESDPLHYVSDCVGNGWLTNGKEGEIAELLLAYGSEIDGTEGRESPLIASASLGAERVSKALIEAGAEFEAKDSRYGATPLFWAVHGYGPDGPKKKAQVGAARVLLDAGASARTINKHGISALELANACKSNDMYELLQRYV